MTTDSLWNKYPTIAEASGWRLVRHPNGPALVDVANDRLVTISRGVELYAEEKGNGTESDIGAGADLAEWIAFALYAEITKGTP